MAPVKCDCMPGTNCEGECTLPTQHKEVASYNIFRHLFPASHGESGSHAIQHAVSEEDIEEQIEEDHKGG